jgi:tRNA (guanine10-N2)-dimethyltransferase
MIFPKDPLCLFLLSGEHASLPMAEVCAILEAEHFKFHIKKHEGRIGLLSVEPLGAQIAANRSAFVNHALQLLFTSPMEEPKILSAMKAVNFQELMQRNSYFGVRITRVKREESKVNVDELQGKIGSEIWHQMNGAVTVKLTNPDIQFMGVIDGERFHFGIFLASRDRTGFSRRRSPRRPFFVPSAIHPKTARVMVNLARASKGDAFLDPFCGTGGLILEAWEVGCVPICLDIDVNILIGCQKNLVHFNTPFFASLADTRTPPLRRKSINVIATDPPYGRSSSTKGAQVSKLIHTSISSLAEALIPGGHLCFATPLQFFDEELVDAKDFSIIETHTMRIHQSLSRQIVVLRRR